MMQRIEILGYIVKMWICYFCKLYHFLFGISIKYLSTSVACILKILLMVNLHERTSRIKISIIKSSIMLNYRWKKYWKNLNSKKKCPIQTFKRFIPQVIVMGKEKEMFNLVKRFNSAKLHILNYKQILLIKTENTRLKNKFS